MRELISRKKNDLKQQLDDINAVLIELNELETKSINTFKKSFQH